MRHLQIDAGGSEYNLQATTPSGDVRLVRALSAREADRIGVAARGCRTYFGHSVFPMALTAEGRIYAAVTALDHVRSMQVPTFSELKEAYVSWLLLFQMALEHWRSEFNARFGPESKESSTLADATHQAYDAHRGYRIASAARRRVAHRSMPYLSANTSARLLPNGQIASHAEVGLSVRWLADWPDCRRVLKADLARHEGEAIPLAPHVSDAMEGLQSVRYCAEEFLFPGQGVQPRRASRLADSRRRARRPGTEHLPFVGHCADGAHRHWDAEWSPGSGRGRTVRYLRRALGGSAASMV